MTIEIDESERQILLLAIANLELARPGWLLPCRELADRLKGREMYDRFKEWNNDQIKPRGL